MGNINFLRQYVDDNLSAIIPRVFEDLNEAVNNITSGGVRKLMPRGDANSKQMLRNAVGKLGIKLGGLLRMFFGTITNCSKRSLGKPSN